MVGRMENIERMEERKIVRCKVHREREGGRILLIGESCFIFIKPSQRSNSVISSDSNAWKWTVPSFNSTTTTLEFYRLPLPIEGEMCE